MSHPYDAKAKTGQERAAARYSAVPNKTPESPVLAEARKNPRGQVPDDEYAAAPARQVCNDGKHVRK